LYRQEDDEMETLSYVSFAFPLCDPFAGTLVWGSAGLAIWVCCAALIGMGLHALRSATAARGRADEQQAGDEHWRDAA
jgi:hypothetical protein